MLGEIITSIFDGNWNGLLLECFKVYTMATVNGMFKIYTHAAMATHMGCN